MKKYCYLIILLCCVSQASAQSTKPKLSPLTKQFIANQQTQSVNHDKHYIVKKSNDGKTYASALIKITDANIAQQGLKNIGAWIGTKAGKIWTVKIPIERVADIAGLEGIYYIQLDEPVKPSLSVARITTRVDSVHRGLGLPQQYSGKNVIMGVIDFGFDYGHPTFYDTLLSRYRVKKVWELNGVGTPPTGYNYGHELANESAILASTTDNAQQTHGTGVAGIAAGSGYGSPATHTRSRGIAYDADMVFVGVRRDSLEQQWMEGGFSDFIDGINYIFRYAASVYKPAVVNISWGAQSGPHDGSSLFNEACDNLSGAGKIIVMSAGNDGAEKIHLSKTFHSTDTMLYTFLDFSSPAYKRTWVDIWGEKNNTFCAQVTLYKNGIAGNKTEMICVDDNTYSYHLIGENGTDTCEVKIITSKEEFNDKPRITLDVYNRAADSVGISIKADTGTIHTWNESYYYGYTRSYQSEFSNHGYAWAETGNTTSTVSDMGSAKSVILVGAYASKVSYVDINNNSLSYSSYVSQGNIVPFSSKGPMTDGRIKPDIAAPGLTLSTAYTSYDNAYTRTGSKSSSIVSEFTHPASGKKYYYGEFTGTSASAPATSGIVALMLEANPHMFPSRVQHILAQTAIKDSYTGALPSEGNSIWGHGKINAIGAVKMSLVYSGISRVKQHSSIECNVYPNPNRGNFTLDINPLQNGTVTTEIFSLSGARLFSWQWQAEAGLNSYEINLGDLPRGLYLVKVTSNEGTSGMKMMLE